MSTSFETLTTEYNWPRPKSIAKPFDVQIHTVADLVTHRRWFVLNDIGLGKTFTALWAQDIIRRQGMLQRVLIVAGKSPLGDAWIPSIPAIVPNFTKDVAVLVDVSAQKRKEMYHGKWKIALINPDGLHLICDERPEWGTPDLIIVDESTSFKTWTSRRTKALRTMVQERTGLWLMSAIPDPEGPLDVWAQIKLLDATRVPKYIGSWKEMTMRQVSHFKWVPRKTAQETVAAALDGISTRYVRSDSMDLPEMQVLDTQVDQTKEFTKFAADMMAEAVSMVQGGHEVVARNGAALVSKVLQAASGAVRTKTIERDEIVVPIDCGPRLDLLKEVLSCSRNPALVMSAYTAGLDLLEKQMIAWGIPYVRVDGNVNMDARRVAFKAVQDRKTKVLLGQPAAMAHGVTLTAADCVFWWALPLARDPYTQTNGRLTRFGQSNKMLVVRPSCSLTERKYALLLDSKEGFSAGVAGLVESLTKAV